jgi:RHS repeat-associated protein
MEWQVSTEAKRSYRFTYDALSRIKHAGYNGSTSGGMYNVSYTYDKHGNIKTLSRRGKSSLAADNNAHIDNLTMTYTGNQLLKAEDAVATIALAESGDFKNYSNVATEYTYNKNGAMAKDLNKGITAIQYNSLNLPRMMDIKSPVAEARNEYLYSAGGQKLKVTQKWNPNFSTAPVIGSAITVSTLTQTKTTDYVGNKIYEDGVLKRILVDGGYIEGGVYYFNLTDHLGNNRVVANASGTAIQKNHYYPFGMAFAETPLAEQQKQPYKYNGKELDQMHGLNLYDYSARQYDSAIGRFTTVDPLAEKYYSISPYAYVANNPLKYIDPTGKEIINGLGPNIGGTKKGYDVIEAKRKLGYDNDMIHIYAHASGMGFTYVGADGRSISIRSQKDLVNFLDQNSAIWRTRSTNEKTYVIIHGCGIGEGSLTNPSWLQLISEDLENVTIGGPSQRLEVGLYDEKVMNNGEWVFYENGKLIHSKPGKSSNNPAWIKYDRNESRKSRRKSDDENDESDDYKIKNTWNDINKVLTKAFELGAKFIK